MVGQARFRFGKIGHIGPRQWSNRKAAHRRFRPLSAINLIRFGTEWDTFKAQWDTLGHVWLRFAKFGHPRPLLSSPLSATVATVKFYSSYSNKVGGATVGAFFRDF